MTVEPDDEDRDEDTENARLFREAVRGVRPLRARTSPAQPPRARPRARFTRADRAAVLRESLEPQSVRVHFRLTRGGFATAVLAELIEAQPQESST